jgi:23S rRNA (cytidine1920-2'-O)/16S rRNA (cytidine1409-2'-O)-methyltransferase
VTTRLDDLLVARGLARSAREALALILAGRVAVDGRRIDKAGPAVPSSADVRIEPAARFVSRGGLKLEAALDKFGIDVRGATCLDIGSSTGGFTDCLLQAGAAHVVAVDVGHGQLAWSLRTDPRVTALERTNVRHLDAGDIGGVVDLCAADLSFISLSTCAPALARCTGPDADLLLLVKPQFEAGRSQVGKGGVVRDPAVHRAVLRRVRDHIADAGLRAVDVMPSPLRGADGNVEFFLQCRKDAAATLGDDELDAAVATAHADIRAGS